MTAGIEVQVRKIRSIGPDIIKELIKKHYVMGIITAHRLPRLEVSPHAPEPEVLPGVFKLTPYAEESAGHIKLIGIQAELFPQDFKRVDSTVRRWGLKLVVQKAGVGFFEIEGVAVVSDGYVTRTEELMEFFNKSPIVIEILFVAGEVGQCFNNDPLLVRPTIGEA